MSQVFKLSADAPIETQASDLLGRAGFAASCAEAIANWQDGASLVIAIWGDWGSGKSSLKNLIVENLGGREEYRRPAIVQFNPWQVINADQLLSAFFGEIGKVLERPIGKENMKAAEIRGATWKAYSSALSIGGSIAKSGSLLAGLIGTPAAGASVYAAGEAMERAAKIAKEGAEGLEARAKTIPTKSVSELKAEVTGVLKSLRQPVLVVLDDLDRLTAPEIRQMIQLVKATADFPHLVYLILARRESVVHALKEIAPDTAEEFLEKIVQVPLHIPRIRQSQIARLLTSALDRLLADPNFAKHFDQERWVSLYRDGMEAFFETPRDVNRYVSSLAFHAGVFRSKGGHYEVNAIDLFGIETLRVFTPAFYERLPELRSILTDQIVWTREHRKAQDLARLTTVLNLVEERRRASARHILEVLFPPAAALFAGHHFSDTSQETAWVIGLRIASERQFERYFGLSVPSDELSEDELQSLLAKMSDRVALQASFADLHSRGLLEQALSGLDYHRFGIVRTDPAGVLLALFSLDVHGKDGFFLVPFSPRTHIWRIVYAYLREEASLSERAKLFVSALRTAGDLATCVGIAQRAVTHSDTHTSGPDVLLAQGKDIAKVKAATVSRIKKESSSVAFREADELQSWLQVWKAWGRGNEPQEWAKALCRSSAGFLSFLRAFRTIAHSQGGSSPITKEHEFFALASLEEFVDISVLRAQAAKLKVYKLGDDERRIASSFQKALRRRDSCQPDYTILSWTWEEATSR